MKYNWWDLDNAFISEKANISYMENVDIAR